MTDIAKSITDRLAELGTEPDEIAEKLLELGCTGTHLGRNCPIAHYLKRDIPQVSWVTRQDVEWDDEFFTHLPQPVMAFVDLFDRGAYPELSEVL
jgi:hypothetical protein